MGKSLILCDCLGSQSIDKDVLEKTCGVKCSPIHSRLCTSQSNLAADAISAGDVIIACAQERERFEEIAAELGVEPPQFLDLRDRAGWSDDETSSGPKMAALVAESLLAAPPIKALDVISEGLCLILGPPEVALGAATQLSQHLNVTVLLETPEDLPLDRGFDVIIGHLKTVTGTFGNFSVQVDGLCQIEPGGRGAFALTDPQDGGQTECDIILDLRGDTPLFPAPDKRDGYLRADPSHAPSVARVVLEASHMVGTFEKPLYLSLDPHICAHSRAEQTGCDNCLNICPTGAITSTGDHVDIDPMICAGCGGCSAVCPSGAITFDDPPLSFLFQRIHTLAETYLQAGGNHPRLLVCDAEHGAEMVSLAARFGRGLPGDVIPLELNRVSGFGHAEILAALACGFTAVDVLLSPKTERDALQTEFELALALAGEDARIRLLEPGDPDALTDLLYGAQHGSQTSEPILPLGTRRQVTRLAVKSLRPDLTDPIALPVSAPYGAVLVDTDACTLCLSCASLCPAGALGDNPDMPQLRFQEDACLQCGLCVNVCPENAISLVPQFDLSDAVFTQRVVHEEEPCACVECGKLFGVKSTIDKIVEKLEGNHAMFANSDATRLIRMCDDCRVKAQFKNKDNPFAGGDRPRVRTTEDYFSKRKDH